MQLQSLNLRDHIELRHGWRAPDAAVPEIDVDLYLERHRQPQADADLRRQLARRDPELMSRCRSLMPQLGYELSDDVLPPSNSA